MLGDSLHNRRRDQKLAWMLWPVRALSLVALAIAGYLFWAHTSGAPIAGCDPMSGMDCGAALSSRWSQWFGIPVLWIGAACYALIFGASWALFGSSDVLSAAAWRVFVGAVLVAGGAGFWFLGLQLTGQSSLCPYCIGIHCCGLTIATIVGVYLIARAQEPRQPAAATLAGLRSTLGARVNGGAPIGSSMSVPPLTVSYAGAMFALAALVGGQILFAPLQYQVAAGELDEAVDLGTSAPPAPPETELEPESKVVTEDSASAMDGEVDVRSQHEVLKVDPDVEPASAAVPSVTSNASGAVPRAGSRTVELLKGKLKINTAEHPMVGNPAAEHVIVEFFDYTCPACRKMHKMVSESMPKYGDQLAVVLLPVPNDILCNKYVQQGGEIHRGACKLANLAVATADLDHSAFEKLHDWLMASEKVPTYGSSLSRASKNVDQRKLREQLKVADVSDRVQRYIELYATLGRTVKPALPMQILGDEIVTGVPASEQELRDLWEQHLGVKPVQ